MGGGAGEIADSMVLTSVRYRLYLRNSSKSWRILSERKHSLPNDGPRQAKGFRQLYFEIITDTNTRGLCG